MIVTFRTSSAGIAGDPDKLLYANADCGIEVFTMYDTSSWFNLSFYFARKRLIRRIKNIRIVI